MICERILNELGCEVAGTVSNKIKQLGRRFDKQPIAWHPIFKHLLLGSIMVPDD